MSGVEPLTIGEPEQRLDRWFRKQYPHVDQGSIEKICRRSEIHADGGRVKPAGRVGPGRVVRVPPPLAASPAPDADTARVLLDVIIHRNPLAERIKYLARLRAEREQA